YWPWYARLVRGQVLSLREREYVTAARVAGAGSVDLLRRHLLPNVAPYVILQVSLDIGYVILYTSSLSFLGLGAQPPTAEWAAVMMEANRTKFVLDEDHIPRAWYNIAADLPFPPHPVIHPGTGQPIGPADLAPLFPMALIGQEVSADREIEIPKPVRDAYRLYRPSPLVRARRLERQLDTPAHIYFKYEGGSPAGSHKPNTAIAQAFYNAEEGAKRIGTGTG